MSSEESPTSLRARSLPALMAVGVNSGRPWNRAGVTFYIYIYAFSRRFYPKRLTLHSSYSFTFYQLLLSLGIEPMILALLAPCSTIWATGKPGTHTHKTHTHTHTKHTHTQNTHTHTHTTHTQHTHTTHTHNTHTHTHNTHTHTHTHTHTLLQFTKTITIVFCNWNKIKLHVSWNKIQILDEKLKWKLKTLPSIALFYCYFMYSFSFFI